MKTRDLAVIALLFGCWPALAGSVTIGFGGTITNRSNAASTQIGFEVGDPFTGKYVFESAVRANNGVTNFGGIPAYRTVFPGALRYFAATSREATVTSSGSTQNGILIDPDAYFVVLASEESELYLDLRSTKPLFPRDVLPLAMPSLSSFDNSAFFRVRIPGSSGQPTYIQGKLNRIEVVLTNDPPVISPISLQRINEGERLTLTIQATDPDVPAQTLTYSLVAGVPPGAGIDSQTGVISWTPTETQGPSTNVITVRVTDNGIPTMSATTNFTIIVNEVNQPPVLSAIPDQTVLAGNSLSVRCTATDPDIPANALIFSLDIGAPVGATIDANTGVFAWTPSAASGPSTNRITVRVTDDGSPRLSDSKTFPVIVQSKPPTNAPPTATITNPPNRAIFAPGNDITVSATASDPDGTVSRVVFYAGTTPLATNTVGPYSIIWRNVPVGDYVLTVKATDNEGLSTSSPPVTIVVSHLSGDVAIVRASDDPEIGILQDYLLQMGLSSIVFDQESISFDLLQSFQAVIWDGIGATNAKASSKTVDVFQQFFNVGKPLYFIGENLASPITTLGEPQRSQWSGLIRLKAAAGQRSSGEITVSSVSDQQHPILRGGFGNVDNFVYGQGIEPALVTTAEAQVLGRSDNADVLVAFPTDVFEDGERTFTQNFRVTASGDAASLQQRKNLFQNVVCWLLHCRVCTAFSLTFEIQGPEAGVRVGDSLTYTNVIQHTGECELSGVVVTNVLAPGLRFVTANSVQGTWHYETNLNVVVFEVGRMTSALKVETSFTVVSLAGGTLTNAGTVQASGGRSATSAQVTTNVEGSARPMLSLVQAGTDQYELRLTGEAARRYRVQGSSDLVNWLDLTNVTGGSWSMSLFNSIGRAPGHTFYRAVWP